MRGEEEQTLAFFDTGILALSIPPFWVWIWLCEALFCFRGKRWRGRRGRNFTGRSGGEIFRLGSSGGRGGLVMDKNKRHLLSISEVETVYMTTRREDF
jgi:hypothetical protein